MKFSQISADVTWDILTAYVDIVGLVSIYQVKKLLKSFNGIVVASGTGLDLTWMDLLDSLPSNQNKCWDVLLHPNCSVGSLLSSQHTHLHLMGTQCKTSRRQPQLPQNICFEDISNSFLGKYKGFQSFPDVPRWS